MSSEPHAGEPTEAGGARGLDRVPLFADPDATLLAMQRVVGRKWQPVVLYHLFEAGSLGFSALKRRVDGVSSKMLSETLDSLEEADLVERSVISDKPVRVEYAPTEAGRSLEPLVGEMVRWGADHLRPGNRTDDAPAGVDR